MTRLGAVVGTHAGPGTVGFFWYETSLPSRTGRVAILGRMSRPQPGFAGLDPPERWPPTRGRFRPERLEPPLDSLPGVGQTLKRRLREARPGAGRRPAPAPAAPVRAPRRSADRGPLRRGRGAIEGDVCAVLPRGRGRLQILTARVADGSGQISAIWFNQPWLAGEAEARARGAAARRAGRHGFAVRSYDLGGGSATADFAPVYPASEEISAAKLRELRRAGAPARADLPDPLPAGLKASAGCRSAATRSGASTGRARSTRPSWAGTGSRSTSCSSSSSRSRGSAAEREQPVAPALPGAR